MRKTIVEVTRGRRKRENIVDFKSRRSGKKQNIGLGRQQVRIVKCEYTFSSNGTELVKLDFQHLANGITETFNFINGREPLDAVMDVIDPTGLKDIDLKKYIGAKMNVEVVESGKFRNIIDAWVIRPGTQATTVATIDSSEEDDWEDEADSEDEETGNYAELLDGEDE